MSDTNTAMYMARWIMCSSALIAAGTTAASRPITMTKNRSFDGRHVHRRYKPRGNRIATGNKNTPDLPVDVVKLGPPRTNHITGSKKLAYEIRIDGDSTPATS